MVKFYIEMGQGIIAEGNDFIVTTSSLDTCSLIAGWNSISKKGGAFHYPADQLKTGVGSNDIDEWIMSFFPDKIIVVHGMAVGGYGNLKGDVNAVKAAGELVEHIRENSPATVEVMQARSAVAMRSNPFGILEGAEIGIVTTNILSQPLLLDKTGVLPKGTYYTARYTLYGKNRTIGGGNNNNE